MGNIFQRQSKHVLIRQTKRNECPPNSQTWRNFKNEISKDILYEYRSNENTPNKYSRSYQITGRRYRNSNGIKYSKTKRNRSNSRRSYGPGYRAHMIRNTRNASQGQLVQSLFWKWVNAFGPDIKNVARNDKQMIRFRSEIVFGFFGKNC